MASSVASDLCLFRNQSFLEMSASARGRKWRIWSLPHCSATACCHQTPKTGSKGNLSYLTFPIRPRTLAYSQVGPRGTLSPPQYFTTVKQSVFNKPTIKFFRLLLLTVTWEPHAKGGTTDDVLVCLEFQKQ